MAIGNVTSSIAQPELRSMGGFLSKLKTSFFAKTNRFRVELFFPDMLVQSTQNKGIELYCENVTLPGMNIVTTQSRQYGEAREIPYDRTFDPVTMTFYVDQEFDVKGAFEGWLHLVQNQTSRVHSYYKSYIKDMNIHVEDLQENTTYTITLFEAYPKTMQSIQLDQASKDIMKMSVTMQYRYWTSTKSENINNSG